ncbi:MAG: hypothetical protein IPH20_23310 [Bacteroidales bacterium]|nr:hypothetical protein [Bacteroidales bacterium]
MLSTASCANKIFTVNNVNLSTHRHFGHYHSGVTQWLILRYRGSSQQHRNHDGSGSGVLCRRIAINYNFSGPAQAYGGNLLLMASGFYAIYGVMC